MKRRKHKQSDVFTFPNARWLAYQTRTHSDILGRICHGSVAPLVKYARVDKHPTRCLFLACAVDTACLAACLPWSRARCCCGFSFIDPYVRHSWLGWLAPLVSRNGSSAGYVPVRRSTNPLSCPKRS